ncbi:PAS domain S-box-containing protein/diguanylate cyclase (GGDEF)-like protein [Plasticicumulans acidivorans]|uniref:PAS domain S-box-containing protein/diguanylate cyclase (GGDEF)-like protein n=2 Tax=Plasticicumulans acidivorans TaxID=886464 RepID=A0A317MU21_9GAMM|nr:PAS domain S-box-containing protein/diguanylate cyclase (GGDEF)-like protein [Plasticicumulans acidivorans]
MPNPMRLLHKASTATIVFCTFVVLIAAVMLGRNLYIGYGQTLNDALRNQAQVAQLLEEHTRHSFDSVELMLNSTAELLQRTTRPTERTAIDALLRERIVDAPLVRQLLLLDGSGRVLGDSAPRSRASEVEGLGTRDWFVLAHEAPGSVRLARPERGRYFGENAEIAESSGLWLVPMAAGLRGEGFSGSVLVAALNPDYFRRFFSPLGHDRPLRISLWLIDGTLLVREPNDAALPPGFRDAQWPAVREARTGLGHGVVEWDSPAESSVQLISFRATMQWPVMLGVAQSKQAALADWYATLREQGIVAGGALLVLLVFARSLFMQVRRRERIGARLKAALALQRGLLNAMPSPVYYKDAAGRYQGCNPAFEVAFGVSERDLQQMTVNELLPRASQAAPHTLADSALFEGSKDSSAYESRVDYADGQTHHVLFRKAPYRDDDGQIIGLVGVMTDLTEYKAQEDTLRMMSLAVEQSPASVVITDLGGNIEFVNRKFELVTGYSREEVIGRKPSLLKSGYTRAEQYTDLWQTISAGGEWHGEFHNVRKNGEMYWEYASISAIRGADGRIHHYMAIKEDITERKRLEEKLRFQASFDALTGLPNRVLLLDRLLHELIRARRTRTAVAVMFVDLDHFKEINDGLGHAAGDELLCRMAQRLCDAVRACDTVGRFGGDEFVIVLSDLQAPEFAEFSAQRILRSLMQPLDIEGHSVQCGASIGITLAPDDGDDCETLLQNADSAMYLAKSAGRGAFRYYRPPVLRLPHLSQSTH